MSLMLYNISLHVFWVLATLQDFSNCYAYHNQYTNKCYWYMVLIKKKRRTKKANIKKKVNTTKATHIANMQHCWQHYTTHSHCHLVFPISPFLFKYKQNWWYIETVSLYLVVCLQKCLRTPALSHTSCLHNILSLNKTFFIWRIWAN